MADIEPSPAVDSLAERLERRRFAIRLHEIEGNPLDREQIELFEMFDREGLSDAERRAYLTQRALRLAGR